MKRIAALVLIIVAAGMCVRAQELKVMRSNGQEDQFSLADIDSITFGVHDSMTRFVLRDRLTGAGDILRIHSGNGMRLFRVIDIDSLCFPNGGVMTMYLATGDTSRILLADVDSMTFASSSANVVSIVYGGATATVDNPLENAGVAVQVAGADVTITSAAGIDGITYALSGTTTDGMFKIYSDGDLALRLNGVQIANANGPAINIQAHVTISVELADGTANALTDGVTYASPPAGEDQKAAFFSEGLLIFSGSGSLLVHEQGKSQHGLGSDDCIVVDDGSIVIESSVKDGIHTNAGYVQRGGSVEVVGGNDGVDAGGGPIEIAGGALTVRIPGADRDALKCSGDLDIAGGDIDLTVGGNQSKGLNAANVRLTGGTVTIGTSGGVVLEASGLGYDPSYCTAVKADTLALLDGCHLTITTTGVAGRGISSDGDIVMQSGELSITSSGGGGAYIDPEGVADAYHGPCLNADGDVVLSGGTVTLSHSGSGGKGISGDGDLAIGTAGSSPTLHITTAGTPIPFGNGEFAEAKAISLDSTITIDDGEITISSADDAIKSKHWIEINGGLIDITNCVEGLESPNLFINGGEIHITSTDDGINATYGLDVEYNDGSVLTINGGYVHLNAPTGDCIDSNGNVTIGGGTIVVHGPPSQPEVGIDANGPFLVSGGLLAVSQINSPQIEVPSNSSTQRSVLLRTTMAIAAGTLFHIEDTVGNSLFTFRPARAYSAILFSSSSLTSGTAYRVITGGSCTGTERDGLYTGGAFSGGTVRASFTSSGMVQIVSF